MSCCLNPCSIEIGYLHNVIEGCPTCFFFACYLGWNLGSWNLRPRGWPSGIGQIHPKASYVT